MLFPNVSSKVASFCEILGVDSLNEAKVLYVLYTTKEYAFLKNYENVIRSLIEENKRYWVWNRKLQEQLPWIKFGNQYTSPFSSNSSISFNYCNMLTEDGQTTIGGCWSLNSYICLLEFTTNSPNYFLTRIQSIKLPPLQFFDEKETIVNDEIMSDGNASGAWSYDDSPVQQTQDSNWTPSKEVNKMTKFESSMLSQSMIGTVIIRLYIRRKRRGQWFTTNICPEKIGKMRKCSIYFQDISLHCTAIVESSDMNFIKLSQWGKSSSDCSKVLQFPLRPQSDSQVFSFFVVPVSGTKGSATVSIKLQFTTNILDLHQWGLTVANHKYESSPEGISQSKLNDDCKTFYLFCPEKQRAIPSNDESELELQLLDSLFLLQHRLRDVPQPV